MFLKALTIKGFKSFADSAQLVMEPGVTVVVGPNGSGKSNVVDAIGWVLGAQAPSAVRSQKMDDVIFAGTQKRPALGRAEVSLTIDNSAGLLPIEFTEVTITRTLFRSGDSEYSINGVPCRLLDIQELLSDTGVGRQQHVIISQGQIDAVLNARAEDRRLIIEEAAGVLKFRRRKEKAERRLAATEANLLRVQDMLREVRRQLRPLEKQADAARRHGSVVAELQALRTYVAGQELLRLRQRLAVGERDRATLGTEESTVRETLRRLDGEVLEAESKLSAMGGDDLGDTLVRFESLRERGRGQAALLAERTRGLERERAAAIDEAVIASLEADAARIAEELAGVEASQAELGPALERLGADEEALANDRLAFDERWGDGTQSSGAGDAAELRTRLGAARAAVERGTAERRRVAERQRVIDERLDRAEPEMERLRIAAAEAVAASTHVIKRRAGADGRVAAAEAALGRAEETARAADGERHAWRARAGALADALDKARAKAGAARLEGLDGVIGTLLDVVDVDGGWQDAFEAAAGEALAAVVVDGADAGRRALAELRRGEVTGAVLALDPAAGVPRTPVPAGGEPVRRHVRGTRAGVDTLLDVLVGSAVAVDGWEAAVDLALHHPGAVVVTRSGDRFAATGWRLGSQGEGATAAAHAEAERKATLAADAAAAAQAEVQRARDTLKAARAGAIEATRAADDNERTAESAATAADRLTGECRDLRQESAELQPLIASLDEQIERDRGEVAEVERLLPAAEAAEATAADQAASMAAARHHLDEQLAALTGRRRTLDVQAAGFEERRQLLRRRLDEVDERLSRNVEQRQAAEARRVELDAKLDATRALAGFVDARLGVVESELATLRERRRRQSEAARVVATSLEAVRKERADAEKQLGELRERMQRAEIDHAEVKLRVETAVEALRRDLDCEPDDAMGAEHPDLPDGVSPPARVRELERDLRLMGPINPLALEEFQALQERHQFLEDQLEDVKTTRRDLGKVIKAIDAEIVNVFASAFADVAQNFTDLFDTLFPGGKGRLRLTEPDNLLETGIEVEARPSGKNVRKLSLLSGGERSLTALAYLFAVFRARPSPFYVMDEVEAALDDVNLHRFLGLVHEFRAEAQLIIVSHQKRTMEAADCLYGVTMKPGGSSHVVSERVTA